MITTQTFTRPDRDAVDSLAAFGSATLHEAIGQSGALPFPIKPKTQPGSVGLPIICAGVAVAPGDVVVGDDDGGVVVPRDRLAAAAAAAQQRDDKEAEMREKIKAGATTIALLGLARYLGRDS